MNERGKSDGPVVPAKLPNKAGEAAAEVVGEGVGRGEHGRHNVSRTQGRARCAKRAGPCA